MHLYSCKIISMFFALHSCRVFGWFVMVFEYFKWILIIEEWHCNKISKNKISKAQKILKIWKPKILFFIFLNIKVFDLEIGINIKKLFLSREV